MTMAATTSSCVKEENLDELLMSVKDHIARLEFSHNEVDAMRDDLCQKSKEVEKKEKKLDFLKLSYEDRLRSLEERERNFVEVDAGFLKKKDKRLDLDKKALEIEEKRLKLVEAEASSVKKRQKQVDVDKGLLDKRLKAVDEKEKSLEKRLKAVDEKEKRLDFDKTSMEKHLKAIDEWEKRLDLEKALLDKRVKLVEEREKHTKEVEAREKQIEFNKRLWDMRLKAVEEKEKRFDDRKGSLDMKVDEKRSLEKRIKEVEKKEKRIDFEKASLEKRGKEVEEQQKQVDYNQRLLDNRMKEVVEQEAEVEFNKTSLELLTKQLDSDREMLEDRVREVEKKEKLIDSEKGFLENRRKEVEEQQKQLDHNKRLMENRLKDIVDQETKVDFNKRFLEKRLKEVGEQETEVDFNKRLLEKRLKEVLEQEKQVDFNKRSLEDRMKEVVEQETEVDFNKRSLENRLKAIEEKENKFNSFHNAKMRELVSFEEQLSRKREEFFKSANEKIREGDTRASVILKKLQMALDAHMEIKSMEAASKKSLAASAKEAYLIQESVEKQFKEFEKMEEEFNSTLRKKEHELVLKEQKLDMDRETLRKEVQLKEQAAAARLKESESTRESMEKRLKELEKREKEYKELVLKEQTLNIERKQKLEEVLLKEQARVKVAESNRESMEKRLKELQNLNTERKRLLKEVQLKEQAASARLKEYESMMERFKEFEKMEKEFNSTRKIKDRKLVLKEQNLSMEWKKLLEEVHLKEKAESARVDEVESIRESMEKQLKEFEKKEKEFKSTLEEKDRELHLKEKAESARVDEVESIRESIEKQLKEFEKKEKEFKSTLEEKDRELVLKEQQLSMEKKELLKGIQLREQSAAARVKEAELEKLLKEFEKKEKEFKSILEEKDRELVLKEQQMSMEKKELLKGIQLRDQQLTAKQKLRDELLNAAREAFAVSEKEIEKRKEEFNLYQEKRTRELVLEDEKLSIMKEKFIKQEKLVHGLLERLESAENYVKNLKRTLTQNFKEIDSKEGELESARDWFEREMNEVTIMEPSIKSKKRKLQLEETCSNKHRNQVHQKRDLAEKHDLHLSKIEQQPDYLLGELNSEEKQNALQSKELELKKQQLNDILDENIKIENDAPDLKLVVEKEGGLLELLIRGPPEKDLEVTASEVHKLLLQDSDPAKKVLDAMKQLSSPPFRKQEMVSNVRGACILLLEKLAKIAPTIKFCVREEAIKLSSEWKSNIKATGQNPVEILEFLNLLAAYNLAKCFDKHEILSFLITVAEHKQTPELCRILGFTDNMTDFVRDFLQNKQYLLASIYIREFKLEHTFPQAAVLNYYVKHSRRFAKVNCNSLEAQDKAITVQITALEVLIEHIRKYGLELDFSPEILKVEIKKLKQERTTLQLKQQQVNENTRNPGEKQSEVVKEALPEKRSSYNHQTSQNLLKKRRANGCHDPRMEETDSTPWLRKHVEEGRSRYLREAFRKRRKKKNLGSPRLNERTSMSSKSSIRSRLGRVK